MSSKGKSSYLLRDGNRIGDKTYPSSVETARLIATVMFPDHEWSIETKVEETSVSQIPLRPIYDIGLAHLFGNGEIMVITFDAIPDDETRIAIKQLGFRWFPKAKQWRRSMTTTALETHPLDDNDLRAILTKSHEKENK